MSKKKNRQIHYDAPVLPGRLEVAMLPCGKPNCRCKDNPPKLHGPYYRWTGLIEGKQTSRTLTQEMFKECQTRIKNYKKLKAKIDLVLDQAISRAPWNL